VPKKSIPVFIVIFLTLTFSSCTCIYFNTFHNIRKNFSAAEKTRRKDGREKAKGAEIKQYNTAVTKASGVLERHPNSSYVDDALYIIGTSYYYLEEFDESARKFKELFANYPESEYIPRSRLMFAKAKLQLKEEAEAVVIFEDIFEKETNKEMKANAARSLGQYFFNAKEYEKANVYFRSLIDSLGGESDKLQAYTFMADGFFDLYQFDDAFENYDAALKHDPDTLQYYRIVFRMAECDYFLNNISAGLEKLTELAENEQYYDSLAAIRLMMAEGYEWDGDLDAAIDTYEKVILENAGKNPAAVAYYYLGLIYQYDMENLPKARNYYSKAHKERRDSPIYEDATKRASTLSLMEQYSRGREDTLATDSVGQLSPEELDQISESQYLLGELFYFDLEKPDSAMDVFQTLLDKYPESRYAPRALMSMAYIHRNDLGDTAMADSFLRRVLSDYPRFDDAETVVNLLGLAGTLADTGYAALTFSRAERFFEEFQELDSTRYYFQILADSILADSMRIADSIRVADSMRAADSTLAPDSAEIDDSIMADDSILTPDSTQAADSALTVDSTLITDTTQVIDSVLTVDSVWAVDSIWTPDSALRIDSVWAVDSIWLPDSIWTIDDSTAMGDSLAQLDSILIIDSILATDSTFSIDSVLVMDSVLTLDSTVTFDSAWTVGGEPEADSLPPVDYWKEAFVLAVEKYDQRQMELLDSAYYYYRYIIDSFPMSDYSVQARYVLLHIYDNYLAPGDSSLIDLYGAFVDSFPETEYADAIAEQYNIRPLKQPKRKAREREQEKEPEDSLFSDEEPQEIADADSTSDQISADSKFITDEEGNQLPPANEYYLREDVAFEYPIEAVAYNIQDKLYFQIRIDFSGEVAEVKLMNPTVSDELNDRIIRTIENTRFDVGRIPPEWYDTWFYYTKEVIMPREYRQ
jgi:TolA-binding protein